METENAIAEIALKPEPAQTKSSLMRTVISLSLYIAIDYWIFKSWTAVFILVTVIVIHELGHFIAMKFFGYKGVNMTFIPFVGAYVSGEASNFSRKNKIIMLFAGPLPGICIGLVLFYLYQNNHEHIYLRAALPFLLLNIFNLLPISPLDGGQIFETLFFTGNRIIQLLFLYISLLLILLLTYKLKAYSLILIAFLIFIRIGSLNLTNKVRKQLYVNSINFHKSYDDLTDEEYWQIRDTVIENSKTLSKKYSIGIPDLKEHQLIAPVKTCLFPKYEDEFTNTTKIIVVSIWLISFCAPIFYWLHLKGFI